MRRYFSMALVAIVGSLGFQPVSATVPILSLNLFSGSSTDNCEDTIPGSGCSPLGITAAGSLTNPFLNNIGTKAISLLPGSYYLFGNPYSGTNFMTQGSAITLWGTLLNGPDKPGYSTLVVGTSIVPDLSVAGITVFDLEAYGIKVTTTGITDVDRMSFGNPPRAFAPDGNMDFVLRLDYLVSTPSAVPEPATWAMLMIGFFLTGTGLRRRKVLKLTPASSG